MTVPAASPLRLRFDAGTVCLQGLAADAAAAPPGCRWDGRVGAWRAPALAYAPLVLWLRAGGFGYEDEARAYRELELGIAAQKQPYPYQREALQAWSAHAGRGVVVLPTGTGKTLVATLAIEAKRRSTIVVVPTIDLLGQWHDVLSAEFAAPVGIVGGGYHEPADITVTTYDSAYLHMERLGNRFGLVIFDECHHLPGPSYATAARSALAPFRLGLTATPEREDGGEALYAELVGPVVYRRDITELCGSYLCEYETRRIEVELSPAERQEYEQARALYLGFLRQHGIQMSSAQGWTEFIMHAARSAEGRVAFLAYRHQRTLAMTAGGKLDLCERLLHAHRRDRMIVFTEDNATVYRISRRFLLPVITHQTKVKERSRILAALASGEIGAVVTSKVLNEGVDVPEANVAIVLSGSGSVREHVQRLGRILRKREGKRAVLYELVSTGTAEMRVSTRRRGHSAYRHTR
ncbi:MAG: DEAD/DEAH box helicase [Deltaproteobacteria bacterium]|nr:DEAD/DEAH box helicase [Deltaproteobacteria bacterium]